MTLLTSFCSQNTVYSCNARHTCPPPEIHPLVYPTEYCKASDLPSVTQGTWDTTTKVDFLSYAKLSCADDYYASGSFNVQCRFGGNFSIATTPTCVSKSK